MQIEDMNMDSDFLDHGNFQSDPSSRSSLKEERSILARLKKKNKRLEEEN